MKKIEFLPYLKKWLLRNESKFHGKPFLTREKKRIDDEKLTITNFTQSNLNTFQKLNQKLKSLEEKLLKEAITLDEVLLKRVEDKEDLLHDYEINLIISFYLKENDVHYDENEDNILVTLREYLKNISIDNKKNPWRWSANHNEFRGQTDHLMKDENHCWLYHSLYDHTHLSFEDLLRIGTIWSDIEVCYQYVDTVDGN